MPHADRGHPLDAVGVTLDRLHEPAEDASGSVQRRIDEHEVGHRVPPRVLADLMQHRGERPRCARRRGRADRQQARALERKIREVGNQRVVPPAVRNAARPSGDADRVVCVDRDQHVDGSPQRRQAKQVGAVRLEVSHGVAARPQAGGDARRCERRHARTRVVHADHALKACCGRVGARAWTRDRADGHRTDGIGADGIAHGCSSPGGRSRLIPPTWGFRLRRARLSAVAKKAACPRPRPRAGRRAVRDWGRSPDQPQLFSRIARSSAPTTPSAFRSPVPVPPQLLRSWLRSSPPTTQSAFRSPSVSHTGLTS